MSAPQNDKDKGLLSTEINGNHIALLVLVILAVVVGTYISDEIRLARLKSAADESGKKIARELDASARAESDRVLREFREQRDRENAEAAAYQKMQAEEAAQKAEAQRKEEEARAQRAAVESRRIRLRGAEEAVLESAKAQAQGVATSGKSVPVREEGLQFVMFVESYLAAQQLTPDGNPLSSASDDAAVFETAHKAVASKSLNPAGVKFISSSLRRAASKDGEMLYCHAWGELESTNAAGEVVTAKWSVILVGSQFVHPSTLELYRPSHASVDDQWKRYVMVWDVKPKGK